MKKIQFFSVLFLVSCSFILNAQLKLKKEYTVHFATNSYQLNEKAQEILAESLADYDKEQMTIRLQAFTDDVGSRALNEKLATQRAGAVQQYLLDHDVAEAKIAILPSEQLKLNEKEDKATQRQNNRRVAIQFWGSSSQTNLSQNKAEAQEAVLAAFFEQEQVRAQQLFSFEASLGTVIQGNKGTIIQIPPNALVREDGKMIEGKVKFILQEAYSYGDMLLQKLGTSAGGRQLETGGMFFMQAVDESGASLNVKEGLALKATLPSEEAKLPNMQTFEGREDSDGNLDWVPTNQPVETRALSINKVDSKLSYSFEQLDEHLQRLINVPDVNTRLPRIVKAPKFKLRAPKRPNLRITKIPNKEELKAKHIQNNKEANYDYAKRINTKYRLANQKYRKLTYANNRKLGQFRRDSLKFVRAAASHAAKLAKYEAYNKAMYTKLENLNRDINSFDLDLYKSSCQFLNLTLFKCTDQLPNMKANLNRLQNDIAAYEEKGNDFEGLLTAAMAIDLDKLSREDLVSLEKFGKWFSKHYGLGYVSLKKFYKNAYRGNISWSSMSRRIKNFSQRTLDKEKLSPYQLRYTRQLYEKLGDRYNFRPLAKRGASAKELYLQNQKIIKEWCSSRMEIKELKDKVLVRKNELGLLSTEELAQAYGNVMNITTMGWINCDRFIEEEGARMNLEILTTEEYQHGTAIFVVFKDIKSVLPATYLGGKGFMVRNVPKSKEVSIIGIHPVSGAQSAEIFVAEGTIAQLNRLVPNFEEKSLEEVRMMMNTDLAQ